MAFLFGSGAGPAEPNFAVFDNWIHEPAYLSGLIAGKMSKSNIVGAVAAMGIPEVNRLVNAFFMGAKQSNPEVKKKVAFIGSFFDPPKAKEAAIAQIDAGVDVIYAERFGVIEAAAERKIYAISNMSDQSRLAPETVITGPVWNMYPTVSHAIKVVKAGVFTAQDYGDFSRMAKGGSGSRPTAPSSTSCRSRSRRWSRARRTRSWKATSASTSTRRRRFRIEPSATPPHRSPSRPPLPQSRGRGKAPARLPPGSGSSPP